MSAVVAVHRVLVVAIHSSVKSQQMPRESVLKRQHLSHFAIRTAPTTV